MKIQTLMRKFKNEWVLAEVLKEDKRVGVVEAEPIAHSKNQDDVYDALSKIEKGKHVLFVYTGKLPKGMVYSF